MPDDTATPLPRRSAPTGPRSAGLTVVPPPPLAPVIRLSPRTGRSARSAAAPVTTPMLVVLPDVATTTDNAIDVDVDVVLSIQDRIRLRALETTVPRRGRFPYAEG